MVAEDANDVAAVNRSGHCSSSAMSHDLAAKMFGQLACIVVTPS